MASSGVGSPSPAFPDGGGPARSPQSAGRGPMRLRHRRQGRLGRACPKSRGTSTSASGVDVHRGVPTLRLYPAAAGPSEEVAGPGLEHGGGGHGTSSPREVYRGASRQNLCLGLVPPARGPLGGCRPSGEPPAQTLRRPSDQQHRAPTPVQLPWGGTGQPRCRGQNGGPPVQSGHVNRTGFIGWVVTPRVRRLSPICWYPGAAGIKFFRRHIIT